MQRRAFIMALNISAAKTGFMIKTPYFKVFII